MQLGDEVTNLESIFLEPFEEDSKFPDFDEDFNSHLIFVEPGMVATYLGEPNFGEGNKVSLYFTKILVARAKRIAPEWEKVWLQESPFLKVGIYWARKAELVALKPNKD